MALAARATRNRTIERYNRNEMMDRRRICLLLVLWMSPAHADEIRQLRLATNDLVYDRFTRRIYASVPSSAGSGGNSVVPDPANNEATATVTARPAPAADLTGDWAGVEQQCVRLRTGLHCTLRGTLHLRNPGDRDAPASVIRFFLSADQVPDRQDRPLKAAATGILTRGGMRSIRLSAALPDGIRAGGKYVIAVLDAENAVPEADEGNNVIVFGPIR
jgi:hypothetical protein